ncbi:glycosyltransferase [Sphingomonas sp. RB3P16]|uniref:glycosyltransferase family 4 protein n=1 Tax=Parasphingomonas frigoris TaxID=3096163 RepID=UPI002FC6F7AB
MDLATAARAAGYIPHLVQPSPTITGRMPVLTLLPEMAVFETHQVRGLMRFGRRLVSVRPKVYAALGLAAMRALARKVGARGAWAQDVPLPHSILLPWTAADRSYVRRASAGISDIAIADYIFCATGLADLADPAVPTAIVMHDLHHARDGMGADSITPITRDQEIALLDQADAVICIQSSEAGFVTAALPHRVTILAPMAADPSPLPAAGARDRFLFVGSNTPPNVVGLQWFFAEVWPLVLARFPDARLDIAGTVRRAFPDGGPHGTVFHGLVEDLGALYDSAGIVISPLTFGSGLKIKLIEALARGKAVVATSITLQGVEAECADAVLAADDPRDFANAILALNGDDTVRADLAAAALAVARNHFSAAACYGSFTRWLDASAQPARARAGDT